jgi:hypothetical protein
MATFEYRQAEEIRDAFAKHGVRYLFIGKSGAILLGYPDTTQDADVYVEKSIENGRALVLALRELEFEIDAAQQADIERGRDFIQLKNGPFDLDLIFAPDGIETFEDAWKRKAFSSVTLMTSSARKRRRIVAKIGNRWSVCAVFGIIGRANRAGEEKFINALPDTFDSLTLLHSSRAGITRTLDRNRGYGAKKTRYNPQALRNSPQMEVNAFLHGSGGRKRRIGMALRVWAQACEASSGRFGLA